MGDEYRVKLGYVLGKDDDFLQLHCTLLTDKYPKAIAVAQG